MRVPVPVSRTRGRRRVAGLYPSSSLVLVAEAGLAGFYIAITRGLAPVLLAYLGLGVRSIMAIVLAAYAVALAVLLGLSSRGVRRLRRALVAIHGSERVAWGLLPLVALAGPLVLVPVYAAAVTLATLTGLLMNVTVFSLFQGDDARRVIAHRSAASASSNIIGQLVALAVLAAMRGYAKYIYLYVLASGTGLIATGVLAASGLPLPERVEAPRRAGGGEVSEEEAVSGTVFLYMLAYMASSAVLAAAWAPYLIRVLGAPDYVAASLGLVQMITSIAASLYWLRMPYPSYRFAVAALPLVPLAVLVAESPLIHLGLAGVYAFSATGANLLASFLYASLSRRLGAFESSVRIAVAASAAQVIGLSVALAASSLGLWAVFASSTLLAAVAAFVALYSLPEVALVTKELALVHARRLYLVTSAALGFIVVASKRTALLVLRALALFLALAITLFAYRLLYYLVVLH